MELLMAAIRIAKDVDAWRSMDMALAGAGSGPFIMGADNEPEVATFGVSIQTFTPAATPTDVVTIAGTSALNAAGNQKIIRLKEIIISGVATAASNIFVNLKRRSLANSGGTFNAMTGFAHDVNDGASSAAVGYYTANPASLGTTVGILHAGRLNIAPASNGAIDRIVWDWSWKNDKAVVLRGAADILCVNLNGAAWPAGGQIEIDLTWTEE
jgi:hypothetical protein